MTALTVIFAQVAEEEWKDVVILLTALVKRLEEQEDVTEPMVAFLLPLLNDVRFSHAARF